MHCLLDKKRKITHGSPAVATARIGSEICQGQPQQCTQISPDFIEIGSL